MDLRSYLFHNRLKSKKVADDLLLSSSYFSLLKTERARPSKRLARDICQYTNGQVTMEYLRSLPQYNNQRLAEA